MLLYNFSMSSGSYRVRIALGLKGLSAEMHNINLTQGEHLSAEYAHLNPQRMVPVLVDAGHTLTQSLAIIEYLEETHPAPPLLPADAFGRARVRAIAQAMACDIGPLNNLKIRKYIHEHYNADEREWIQHWTHDGLSALETKLAQEPHTGRFCHGDTPTLADCCLVPQLYHARRFGCALNNYPILTRIDAACAQLPAFQAAHPENKKAAL